MAIGDIAAKVQGAGRNKQKIAMFHFQILIHADELKNVNAAAFCKEIGVPATYATEFHKMLSLARLMEEQGVRVH